MNPSLKDRFAGRFAEAGGRLRVKSAVNPALWLCFFVTVPCIAAAVNMEDPPLWLIVLAFIPVCMSVVGYMFLLFFDRDKLQSEDYQLKKMSLELIREQEKGGAIEADPSSIVPTENPAIPANPVRNGEES